MQIAPFFRLKELGTYGEGRSVPPEPAEKVGTALCFANPAGGRDFGCTSLKIKTIHSFFGNRLVSLQTQGCRRSSEVQIQRRLYLPDFRADRFGKIADRGPNRSPRLYLRNMLIKFVGKKKARFQPFRPSMCFLGREKL
ncbi:MAG: hypothetical protein AUK24_00430 [Syntrophaceae bacterium CG2_30_49_12]|nr:MAG: hypothetical protein AUK24_00430 [Syntrophaceae bacterium CG2_30_49_12]